MCCFVNLSFARLVCIACSRNNNIAVVFLWTRVPHVDPLRVIIMRNSCLVFVPDGADSLLSILKEKFLETTQHESAAEVAYEFK